MEWWGYSGIKDSACKAVSGEAGVEGVSVWMGVGCVGKTTCHDDREVCLIHNHLVF